MECTGIGWCLLVIANRAMVTLESYLTCFREATVRKEDSNERHLDINVRSLSPHLSAVTADHTRT